MRSNLHVEYYNVEYCPIRRWLQDIPSNRKLRLLDSLSISFIQRLLDDSVLSINSGKVEILNFQKVQKYKSGILPFGGILGLTATAIYNQSRDHAFSTYEEFKESIVKLESQLPIRDELQIIYLDEVDEIETYYYFTIQKFVQEQILDKQNHDKFSDWWDLAQEGKSKLISQILFSV